MSANVPKTKIINDLIAINGRGSANLTGVVGAGTMTSEWIDLVEFRFISFDIAWSAVAATAGTISFDGTNDPAQAGGIVTCPPSAVIGNGASLTTGVTASAVVCNFIDKDFPRFLRYKNVQTAGGAVGQFSGWAFARSH